MIQFKEINGNLCRMLEQPIPLTEKAKFPCVVRLIQDDSPMGRYNNRLTYKCLLPFICIGIDNKGDMERMENAPRFGHECYEILGYPVADDSTEWALYHMMQGDKVIHKYNTQCHYIGSDGNVYFGRTCLCLGSPDEWLTEYRRNNPGWHLYEPDQFRDATKMVESCPTCNGTGKVEKPAPAFNVGDWVECNGNQRLIEVIGRDLGRGNYYHFAHGFGGAYANSITRKLSPFEVVVTIGCLSGTVRKSSTGGDYFRLFGVDGEASIDFVMLDAHTLELVLELIEKQEGDAK